jgi:hypothetical protein
MAGMAMVTLYGRLSTPQRKIMIHFSVMAVCADIQVAGAFAKRTYPQNIPVPTAQNGKFTAAVNSTAA